MIFSSKDAVMEENNWKMGKNMYDRTKNGKRYRPFIKFFVWGVQVTINTLQYQTRQNDVYILP